MKKSNEKIIIWEKWINKIKNNINISCKMSTNKNIFTIKVFIYLLFCPSVYPGCGDDLGKIEIKLLVIQNNRV